MAVEIMQDRILAVYAHVPGIRALYIIQYAVHEHGNDRSGEEDSSIARVDPLPMTTTVHYRGKSWSWDRVLGDMYGVLSTEEMRQRWQTLFDDGVCFPPEFSLHNLSRAT